MLQNPERRTEKLRQLLGRLAPIVLLALLVPTAPSFAQASAQVRVKIVKAGLLVGGGAGTGVLTYRGRQYSFGITGLSLGFTAGATVGRLEGRASGIREIGDFACNGYAEGSSVVVAVRPQGVHLAPGSTTTGTPGRVVSRHFLGEIELFDVAVEGWDAYLLA